MSRSSGYVWARLVSVTRTRNTAAVRPETAIVDGYGLAAPRLGMTMGAAFENCPEGAITRVTWLVTLFCGAMSTSKEETRAELVTRPGLIARPVTLIVAP